MHKRQFNPSEQDNINVSLQQLEPNKRRRAILAENFSLTDKSMNYDVTRKSHASRSKRANDENKFRDSTYTRIDKAAKDLQNIPLEEGKCVDLCLKTNSDENDAELALMMFDLLHYFYSLFLNSSLL